MTAELLSIPTPDSTRPDSTRPDSPRPYSHKESIEFTDLAIKALPLGTYRVYYDTVQPRLSVRVMDAAKTFYFKGKNKSVLRVGQFLDIPLSEARLRLGQFSKITVAEARAKVAELLTESNLERDKPRVTFGFLFKEYMDNHIKLHRKSAEECEGLYRRYFRDIYGEMLIENITNIELQKLHVFIGENHGKTAANRALELFSTVFNRAKKLGNICATKNNPASVITRYRLASRTRFLSTNEAERLYKAVMNHQNPVMRDFIRVLWFTAQRFSEIRYLRWEYVNLEMELITLPDTKNGLDQWVPLTKPVLEILKRRKVQSSPDCEWVFPAPYKKGQPIDLNTKGWRKILEEAKIEKLRIHDLRRSTASHMSINNTSIPIISQALNHKDIKSSMIYAKVNMAPVREHVTAAIYSMLPFLNTEKNENSDELAKEIMRLINSKR